VLTESKDKQVESIPRRIVRTLEFTAPPQKVPNAEDARAGPDVVVRLKNGDLLARTPC